MPEAKPEVERLAGVEVIQGIYSLMNKETRLLLNLDGGKSFINVMLLPTDLTTYLSWLQGLPAMVQNARAGLARMQQIFRTEDGASSETALMEHILFAT